jgi:hypothetical protein
LDHALKTHSETGVHASTKTAGVQVPRKVFGINADGLHFFFQDLQTFFPLAAANDFANAREQNVHGADGFPIVV